MSETTSHDRPQERMTPFATNGHTVHPSVPSHEIQASHAQHESRGPADDPLCDNEFGIAKNAIEAPRAVPPDSDEDAEGDDDGEFDIDATANDNGLMRLDTPEFATTTRPLKRKSDADEDDFMSQNPELYGLRRSVSQAVQSASSHSTDIFTGSCPTSTRCTMLTPWKMSMAFTN